MQPVAAAKLTGKGFGTDIALLSAVDDPAVSPTGEDHPIYNLLRLQRDVGAQSRLGVVYTDRIVGSNYNRVAGRRRAAPVRRGLQSPAAARRQPHPHRAASRPRRRSGTPASSGTAAPSDSGATAQRAAIPTSGRRAASSRGPGLSHANLDPRVTLYGKAGGLVESVTGDVNLDGLYRYDQFFTGAGMQEEKLHFNTNVRLRGGWTAGASVLIEQFGYPAEVYEDYRIELPRAGGTGRTRCRSSAGRRSPTATTCCRSRRRSSPSSRATPSSSGATTRTSRVGLGRA